MMFLACFVIFGTFVRIDSLNPRSVNVAVETVLEFDGKHNYRDVKAIDKLQNYLSKIKKILNDKDSSRRYLSDGYKFRDFLKNCLQIIMSYDDNDLLDVVAIVNNEIRKYHYKGCKFYELVENQNFRRDMADKLLTLNELTAKELRNEISEAMKAVDNDVMSEKRKKMLDYLDSVYVGDEIKGKMQQFLTELEQFKSRSKRASLNLVKVIKDGLRYVLFGHYSSLNNNARTELKTRLENFWHDHKKANEDVWNIRPITIRSYIEVSHKPKKAVWNRVATTPTDNNLKIIYPYKYIKPKRKKKMKYKPNYESLNARGSKKYKYNHKTTRYSDATEVTKSYIYTHKRPRHATYHIYRKEKQHKPKTTTYTDTESSDEVKTKRFVMVKDSLEVHKKRQSNKDKPIKKQRIYSDDEDEILRTHFRKQKTKAMSIETDDRSDSLEISIPMRKSNDNDTFNNGMKNNTLETTTIPSMVSKIDRIEKVLFEIKDLVKNVPQQNSTLNLTTQKILFENLPTVTKNKKDEDREVNYNIQESRKSFDEDNEDDFEEESLISKTSSNIKISKYLETNTTRTPKISIEITETTEKVSTENDFKTEIISEEDHTKILTEKTTKNVENIPKETTASKSTTIKEDESFETTIKLNTDSLDSKFNTTETDDHKDNVKEKIKNSRTGREAKISNVNLEQMLNETRRVGLDNMIDPHAAENKDMHENINKRIEGHMKRLLSMATTDGNGGLTKPLDFNFNDSFEFKDLKGGLHDEFSIA